MSDNDVVLDLQQQRLERALGAELGITQNIIKRTGVFDEVDKKYGIPEKDRQAMDASMTPEDGGGDDMGGAPPMGGADAPPMDDAPLSEDKKKSKSTLTESKKSKILGMLGDETKDFDDLFDIDKAQRNIYEVENKLNDILKE